MGDILNQFNAAVLGLGRIGLMYDLDPKRIHPASHVMAYWRSKQFNLQAVADCREEQEKWLANLNVKTKFFRSLEQLLVEKNLDVISICTPQHSHFMDIKRIGDYSAVKIIFCEKPLVANLKEARCIRDYMKDKDFLIIPNISRRWSSGMGEVLNCIQAQRYGRIEKIHVRYTRGIYNTGAHIFDLLHLWCGRMENVTVFRKVYTTSERDQEPSFSFSFENENGICGFFEAFSDTEYYIFEIDLYFSRGKITISNSGDELFYYTVEGHPLFEGFGKLQLEKTQAGLLKESMLENAIENLSNVLLHREEPKCRMEDAIYPLYVAEALERSYRSKQNERVNYE